eukprot:g3118.t1
MGSFGGQEIKLPALVDWKKQNQVIYQGNVGPAQFKLSTKDCHLKLQPTVYMELSIEWNRVKSFGISVKGDIDMAAGFALDSSMHMYNMTTFDLTTINLPAISFFIGAFPLVLSPSIPIRAGYRYDVNAAASVNFQEQYHGSISTGVALQGGSLQPSFALNVAPKMPSPPTFQGTATIASTAWLSASLVFNVNGIVRETSDAKVYLDLHGSAKSGQPVHANLIGGFNMSIGGDLGVKLAGVLIPPTSQLGYAQEEAKEKGLIPMRPLTEDELKTFFQKLAEFIGSNVKRLLENSVESHCFRLHRDRVYYVSEKVMLHGTNMGRDELLMLGTCFGKFTKSGKFRLHITCLDYLAQYAKYKVWLKPSAEMGFLYGNHVPMAGLGRMTQDTPQYASVVVLNMANVPLGFGVAAHPTEICRTLEATATVVLHQADIGEYLRDEDAM